MAQKSCFLEENPKILVITKFQRAPILQVELETAKEAFTWKSGRSEIWNDGNIYPVKINEILFAKS